MKLKFHWGWGIAVVYSLFVVTLITILILSTGWKNELEDKDYYKKELEYQNQIDKIERTRSLPEQIKFIFDSDKLIIKFPNIFIDSKITGNIFFYRPSDEKLDFNRIIELNENKEQIFPRNGIKPGLWKVKINFQVNGVQYYFEEAIKV